MSRSNCASDLNNFLDSEFKDVNYLEILKDLTDADVASVFEICDMELDEECTSRNMVSSTSVKRKLDDNFDVPDKKLKLEENSEVGKLPAKSLIILDAEENSEAANVPVKDLNNIIEIVENTEVEIVLGKNLKNSVDSEENSEAENVPTTHLEANVVNVAVVSVEEQIDSDSVSVEILSDDNDVTKEEDNINIEYIPPVKIENYVMTNKLKLGSIWFSLFNSKDSCNSMAVFERLILPLKEFDIWNPREGCSAPFVVFHDGKHYIGRDWWTLLPCADLIKFAIMLQINVHGPDGIFYLEGRYFIFESNRIKIVDKELISWEGNKRILNKLPTIEYEGVTIILPAEFAAKKNSIINDHKSLLDKCFDTGETFVLYNRKVKFVGDSMIRVCEYDQWFNEQFQPLGYKQKRTSLKTFRMRMELPMEWKLNFYCSIDEGFSSLKRHVLESTDPLGTPFFAGGVKWMINGHQVNRVSV
ncbi:uncharacterized protein LOC122503263 [Leptopilina heterotoma]|uniref:uncharacterized protein LOC122503263 n=1 Tax=Leptopilina heterotoma TaxID=63436 RepID=UPI001CAA0176|nr:uncharacterized protein LOC122503263 [Leptopilina heterotoma]